MLELQHMFNFARALFNKTRSEDGASAVEYGLLVAAIAALIVVIVFAFGHIIAGVFQSTCNTIGSNSGTTATC